MNKRIIYYTGHSTHIMNAAASQPEQVHVDDYKYELENLPGYRHPSPLYEVI